MHNQLLALWTMIFSMDTFPQTAFHTKQFIKLLDIGKRKNKKAKKAAFFFLENLFPLKERVKTMLLATCSITSNILGTVLKLLISNINLIIKS